MQLVSYDEAPYTSFMQKTARIFLTLVFVAAIGMWFYGHQSTAVEATPLQHSQAAKLPQLTLKEFDEAIKQSDKPTMLFFYASWCPHCRAQMPHMQQLEKRRADDVNILYVSIDEDPLALVSFLEREHPDAEFKPYIVAPGEGRKFARYLQTRNSNFRGGVPYTGVFRNNSQLTHEFLGRAPIEEIEKAL